MVIINTKNINLTDSFLQSLPDFANIVLTKEIIHQVKRCLIDYFGVVLAGSKMLNTKTSKINDFLGGAVGVASIIGMNQKSDLSTAAFFNGLASHVAELDDGINTGIFHPGSPVISALLAVAQKEQVSVNSLFRGIIAGYEAGVRMADSIQPGHKKKGHHATGTCGAIGSAIGISTMLGFSKKHTKGAFSAAVLSACGTLKALENASQLKPYNAARAAVAGIQAAAMAKAEFLVPEDVLNGDGGFIAMTTDSFDKSKWHREAKDPLAILRVYTKPFAACRYCHPAIEAALKLYSPDVLNSATIASIKVSTYQLAVKNHDHIFISGESDAKMSIPYCVAVALISGKAGLSEFSPAWLADSDLNALTKKIKVVIDEKMTSLFPNQCCAMIEVTDIYGETHINRVDIPKGEPDNPLSDHEIELKFFELALFAGKTELETREFLNDIWTLADDLNPLFGYL